MKMVEPWVLYAFIAFLGYFSVNFLFKFVSNENPLMVSMIFYGFGALAMLALIAPKKDFSINSRTLLIALLIGLCSVTATIYALKSIKLAPNPGYSVAIYSSNFVLVAIVSLLVLHSEVSLKKILGIISALIGLLLLSI